MNNTNEVIKRFLLSNQKYLLGDYQYTADKFGVTYERVRHVARRLKKSLAAKRVPIEKVAKAATPSNGEISIKLEDYNEFLRFKARQSAPAVKIKRSIPKPFLGGDKRNTLVIPDTHEPFALGDSLEFMRRLQEQYNCGTVVHIGDLVDNHAVSYHESDPSGHSAGTEFELAMERCKEWYSVFPEVSICIGNHDALPFRKAFSAGLPERWLKSYRDLLESPEGWNWAFTHQHNGVLYTHGTGMSGEMAAINAARENRQSTVIGHLHTISNIKFMASYKDLIFGMTVGCLIDHKQYAFAYGKEQTRKPVIAGGVVIDGRQPIIIPKPL